MDLEREYEPNEERGGAIGYENLPGTEMLAASCVFCGRPLVDPESVERGCGSDCAGKYLAFGGPTSVDVVMLDHALRTAPPVLRDKVAPLVEGGDNHTALQRIIHTAGYHWEHRTAEAMHVLGSAIELSAALGYTGVADKIRRRYVEGLDRGGNTGLVVQKAPDGGWKVRLPYLSNYATWRAIFDGMKKLGARMFKDGKQSVYVFQEHKWLEVLNVFSRSLPGQIGQLPSGELFVVPNEPVPLPAPPGSASSGPQHETGEQAPPTEFKKGMHLELNDGREAVVGWVAADGKSIGVMPLDRAREALKKYGRITPGRAGYEFLGTDTVRSVRAAEVTIEEVEKVVAGDGPMQEAPPVRVRELPESMFSYQRETALWADTVGAGILALDMGLGKTLCALSVADGPVLVVCPASLRVNWVREVNRWRPDLKAASVGVELDEKGKVRGSSTALSDEALKADVVVMSYEGISNKKSGNLDKLLKHGFRTLIVDEAHYIKELDLKFDRSKKVYIPSAKSPARASAVWLLAQSISRKFLLTGTPIKNFTYELWALLAIVAPDRFINFWNFAKRYCAAKQTRFGWDYKGSSNTEELHSIINGKYMMRKTKSELDLPEKSRRSMEIVMDDDGAKEYRFAASQFLAWVLENGGHERVAKVKRAEVLARLTTLRRLAAAGKAEPLVEQCDEFLSSTKRPLVVMGWHTDALKKVISGLQEKGWRVGWIMGETSPQERQRMIDEFQTGEPTSAPPESRQYLDVLVCSIMAAGVGLTLTRASDMFFLERAWTPSDLVQAEDRLHRIGQKNAVTITYYEAAGSIDAYIAKLLLNKTSTAAAVIDGEDLSQEQAIDRVLGEMFGDFSELRKNPDRNDVDHDIDEFDWGGFA